MELVLPVIYFIFLLPLYFLIIFLSWFIPGSLLITKNRLSDLSYAVVSTGVGMVLWAYQGWVFGYLSIRWATYVYLLIFFLWWIRRSSIRRFQTKSLINRIKKSIKSIDIILLLIVVAGVSIQIQGAWFNGLVVNGTSIFLGGHPPDNFWHASLMGSLVRSIPPIQPAMYPELVSHYHYWGNMIVAELVRVYHLPLALRPTDAVRWL